MTGRKWLALTVAIAAIVIATVAYISLRPPLLVLKAQDTGRVYASWRAYEGLTFSVTFIHSVNQSPVCDVFEVKGGAIRAVAARYSSFGAGMQTELEPGQQISYEDGQMVITGFDVTYRALNYIVGTVSDHVLCIEGQELSLRDLCGKNAAVAFELS